MKGFTGKERDAETGLDFFGARYMASAQGRFTSPDAMLGSRRHIRRPQKWNKYAYVLNNPLAFVDPDGFEELKVTVRAGIPWNRTWMGASFNGGNKLVANFTVETTRRGDLVASKRVLGSNTAALPFDRIFPHVWGMITAKTQKDQDAAYASLVWSIMQEHWKREERLREKSGDSRE